MMPGADRPMIRYRSLRRYKYQLVGDVDCIIGIEKMFITPYIESNGVVLTIKTGYAWDGPSGPTIDTKTFMRGSLVHDVLYQLIRLEILPSSARKQADQVLREICIADGMSRFRAWYIYRAVRTFGGSSATPGSDRTDTILVAP
jgi:Protein of unknown function (DUF1353)